MCRRTKTTLKNYPNIKLDEEFVSNIFINIPKITGQQMKCIGTILEFNSECETVEDYIDTIYKAFNYEGSKSSTDYRKLIYGEKGYSFYLENYNKTRNDNKKENLKDDTYIKNMYVASLVNEYNITVDIDLIVEVIKNYSPYNENVRSYVGLVLKNYCFKSSNEYINIIDKVINFGSTRTYENKDYFMLINNMSVDEWYEYSNNKGSKISETKLNNSIRFTNEWYDKLSVNLINDFDLHDKYSKDFIIKTMKGINYDPSNNTNIRV